MMATPTTAEQQPASLGPSSMREIRVVLILDLQEIMQSCIPCQLFPDALACGCPGISGWVDGWLLLL